MYQQGKAHDVMEKYGVRHEAWNPFAEGVENKEEMRWKNILENQHRNWDLD